MNKPVSLEDLKRYRALVETGTPLDKGTVLSIIECAGQLQEQSERSQAMASHPASGVGMTAGRYRKKPVVVEAIQYTGPNINDIARFVGDVPNWSPISDSYELETLEGTMYAQYGDWIIKGVQGEFYPCKPDIFALTYEVCND